MSNNLFFSVVIPTYNRAGLIGKTVQSLIVQTYPNFEIIVVDDGSKDSTDKVIETFKDKRISYYKVANGERGRARNIGTIKAKGDYITFIDSDDLAYPNHLEEAKRIIEASLHAPVLHLAYEMKDTHGNILNQFIHEYGDINRQLLKGNLFSCIGVFLRQDIAKQFLFKEDRKLAGTEDWLLWLSLASRFEIVGSNTITACMINHESRSVLNFDKQQMLDRTNLLVDTLKNDKKFKESFGEQAIKKIEAHMYTYMSLHSVLSQNNKDALSFLAKGLNLNFKELFHRRTLAIIKYLFLNNLKTRPLS